MTYFRLNFVFIFFLKLSFVTKSSVSSLSAYIAGGSLIFKLRHSCLTTSSTVVFGSIRARTVTPSLVVTGFVGTRATVFEPLPLTEGDTVERVVGNWAADIWWIDYCTTDQRIMPENERATKGQKKSTNSEKEKRSFVFHERAQGSMFRL